MEQMWQINVTGKMDALDIILTKLHIFPDRILIVTYLFWKGLMVDNVAAFDFLHAWL